MSTPVLYLLVGPNGAGKSTLATRVIQPQTHLPFVNADLIATERWPGDEAEHAYQAARAAQATRLELIRARESFITETVFSHVSKVDLVEFAVGVGYLVHLHVVMVPVEVTIGRVAHRARHGGHDVPVHKIRERYARLWPLIARARAVASRTTFYDNENDRKPYRVVAVYENGVAVREPEWPDRAPPSLR